jgi:hypothetical protein
VKQYCTYGFNFQAEKTIKELVANYPTDPDVWFELYLYYCSGVFREQLANEALVMSIKLHFKTFAFEYEEHQSFLINLSRFLYSLMIRKHNLENVVYKTETDRKISKSKDKRKR